ncbi:MAG: sigma-70 family RNA polymerase sigma factor [Nocardiopsaceae bacterium]|nr:sigma-70 family RNA polymerase sigma factor [Nocardiopsaceae bacterium]
MATQQSKTEPAEPWGWLAVLLRDGTGYERCYDAFAPQLYRYCWSLVGHRWDDDGFDRAAASVRQVFLASTELIGELHDPEDLRPWYFSLARATSRQRGFAPESPYAELATVPGERPVVELLLRLPPSHRELLELYLRHGLPATRIGTVLGLAPDTSRELCHAAVRRAAAVLAERGAGAHHAPGPAPETPTESEVRAWLDRLEPPGPPSGLRERVLHDCTDPLLAQERSAAAMALLPLGSDGFPLQGRPHISPSTAPNAESGGPDLFPEEPAAVPTDRVTTRDVPAEVGPEQIAELGPPLQDAPEDGTTRRRRRWPAPVVAGLATAAVAAAVGGLVATGHSSGMVTDPGPPGPASTSPVAGERLGKSTYSPGLPAAPSPSLSAPSENAGVPAEDAPTASPSPSSAAPAEPDSAPKAPPAPQPSASGEPGDTVPTQEPPGDENEEGEDDDRRGPVSRLLTDLAELFGAKD